MHPNCSPTDTIKLCEGVSAREFDGEWVILDLKEGNYYGLDEVGGAIWLELVKGSSPKQISVMLTSCFEAAEQRLLSDVLNLVDELVAHGLVTISV